MSPVSSPGPDAAQSEISPVGTSATGLSIFIPPQMVPYATRLSLFGPLVTGPAVTGSSVSGSEASDTTTGSTSSDDASGLAKENLAIVKKASGIAIELGDNQTIPWTGGAVYTESTKPEEFQDWIDYMSFCKTGPKIRMLCLDPDVDVPDGVAYNVLEVSQKFWADHSAYFKAIGENNWKGRANGQIQIKFDDITLEDMVFLQQSLEIEPVPGAHPSIIGSKSKALRRLARAHELADRFLMDALKSTLAAMAKEFVQGDTSVPQTDWRAVFLRDLLGTLPTSGAWTTAMKFHEDKLIDYSLAFDICRQLPDSARVINPRELITAVLDHAPNILVARMCKDIKRIVVSDNFKDHVFFSMSMIKNT